MGQVYRAYDASTDRVVALKVLPPNMAEDQAFQQRFRREARIAASLNDPHVVPIHGYGEIDGQLYVDMRLIEGRDLQEYMAENGGRLSPERAVAVVEQIAAALDSAHEVGLIHRDVKPKNILVTNARDFVYLIDFGIARNLTDTSLTQTGHTMGTVAYMAPERFRGTTDHRADVYSLACVLHECLTGKRPFAGDSLEEQLNAHLNVRPPEPSITTPGVPQALDAVVARGMAKDLDYRYQSAMELAQAARAALGGTADLAATGPQPPVTWPSVPLPESPPAPSTPDPQPTYRPPTQSKRLLIGIVGASALALIAVVALVIALVTKSDHPTNDPASATPTHGRAPNRPGPTSDTTAAAPATVPPLPAFAPPGIPGADCQYPPSPDAASKAVNPPHSGRVSTDPAQMNATISTNFGDIGIHLDNARTPCTVNSFVSLVRQQFFDNTSSGRLVNAPDGGMILLGGPENDGSGGPGYEFADEYPTNQYKPGDPALKETVIYPRGTLFMAGTGPNTNGSQFQIVYRDLESEPTATVFGTVDQASLETVDKMARVGVAGDRQMGTPTSPITIISVRIG